MNEFGDHEIDDEEFSRRQARLAATDLKSLKQQLKAIVRKAQDVVEEELNERRARLKVLLDTEEEKFQNEFALRVKNRIDDSFTQRKNILLSINEERKKEKAIFLESKQMQRQMEECLEFREELRRKNTMDLKESHLYQMLEKERALRRERDMEEFWINVERVNARKAEMHSEENYRKQMTDKYRCELWKQLEEQRFRRLEEEKEKLEEAKKMTALRREILLEDIAKKYSQTSPRSLARGQEQRDEIERRRQQRLAEECAAAEEHRKLIAEIQAELTKDLGDNELRKQELNKTMKDFIAYVKKVKEHQETRQQMRDQRIDELHRIDLCCGANKYNMLKRDKDAEYFSDLRCQVVEECKKRMQDEAIYNDRGIIENRFAREEIEDPVQKALKQRQYSLDLDQQILETKRVWLQEMAAYEKLIKGCQDNPGDCKVLMEYLDQNASHHPNWKILACGKNRLSEIRATERKIDEADIPPEGRIEIPDNHLNCPCEKSCVKDKKCNFSFTS